MIIFSVLPFLDTLLETGYSVSMALKGQGSIQYKTIFVPLQRSLKVTWYFLSCFSKKHYYQVFLDFCKKKLINL